MADESAQGAGLGLGGLAECGGVERLVRRVEDCLHGGEVVGEPLFDGAPVLLGGRFDREPGQLLHLVDAAVGLVGGAGAGAGTVVDGLLDDAAVVENRAHAHLTRIWGMVSAPLDAG